MTNHELLDIYKSMMPFLADVCGPGCEIVLHDVTDPDHSLIAIQHPLSGRKIGDSMTDLALDLQEKGTYTNESHISNYNGKSKGRDFLSSTYFIKNDGNLIGLLCINKDMSLIQEMNHSLHQLLKQFNLEQPVNSSYAEDLDTSVTDILQKRLSEIIQQFSVNPSQMTREEKISVVHQLSEEGLLSVKGMISTTAQQLGISVPTLYRYLNKH